jgi:hypothetical protein
MLTIIKSIRSQRARRYRLGSWNTRLASIGTGGCNRQNPQSPSCRAVNMSLKEADAE